MTFTWIDGIALAILVFMFARGWWAGFIVMAGNLLSLVLGVVATSWLFSLSTNWFGEWHVAQPILAVVVFLVALGIIVRLLRVAVRVINGLYRIVSIVPGVGLVNRLGGAAVGLAEGVLVVVVAVYLLDNVLLAMLPDSVIQATVQSTTYYYFQYLAGLLPDLAARL